MKLRNLKHYKSTVLGLVFIVLGIYLLIQQVTFDYYILGALFVSGILFLFAPDTYIHLLEKTLKEKLFKNDNAHGGS